MKFKYEEFKDGKPSLELQVPVITDKSQTIEYADLFPHFSDARFSRMEHTVFLAPDATLESTGYGTKEVKGAHYVYSDRLWQSVNDQVNESRATLKEKLGTDRTAEYYERFIWLVLESADIKLKHIMTGVNRGNGYPYQVFGYTE